jgi:hypothetical protein
MPRLPLLAVLLFVLGWTTACIDVPEVVDPPDESPDSGSNTPPDAGGNPDAGHSSDAGNGTSDAGPVDALRPTLLNSSPVGGSTEVATNAQLIFTFSEAMDTDSVQVGIQPPAALGSPVWSQQGSVMTLQPATELSENTTYTVTLDGEDVAGNPLTGTRSFSFTTAGPAPDTVAPTVLTTSPSQASIGNVRNALVEVVFSEPMNKASVQAAFSVTAPAGFNGGTFSWNEAGTVMTYAPSSVFSYGTEVTWQVSNSAKDAAGNALAEPMIRGFRIIRQGALTINFDPPTSGHVGAPSYFRQSDLYNVTYLGDDSANETYRLFIGFKLNGLPEDLTRITEATLRWWVTFQQGNPFSKFGQLLMEPVNVGEQLETAGVEEPSNPALIEDYHSAPLSPGMSIPSSAIGAPGTFNVTAWAAKDWSDRAARNGRTQYRLRFTQNSDSDGQNDKLVSDVETHPTLAELHVVYEYP